MAKDELVAVGVGVVKALASRVPVLGELIAGTEGYAEKRAEKAREEIA